MRGTRATPKDSAEDATPPLETESDVWKRAESFLRDVFAEVATEPVAGRSDELGAATERNIMIVSHAGCIRQILFHLVGEKGLRRHPNAASAFEASTDRFIIPNTSLSVIRVCVVADGWTGYGPDRIQMETNELDQAFAASLSISRVVLEQLNWVGHLKGVCTTNG